MQVSDSHFGVAMCTVLDATWAHLGLRTDRGCLAAQAFLERNLDEKRKRALELENEVTEKIFLQYQQSTVSFGGFSVQ
jgi:hypothetical protein